MYIGHRREDGTVQLLGDHLQGVAALSSAFASAFGAEAHAYRTGQMHDAGKYSRAGQRRMSDPAHTAKVDHSTAGAQIAQQQLRDGLAALAIAGHHGGMPDLGGKYSAEGDGTLAGRCRKALEGDMDYSAFWDEIQIDPKASVPTWLNRRDSFELSFYARMLFSCLVDADFLDTERFMRGEAPPRGGGASMAELLEALRAHVAPWLSAPTTALNEKRCAILENCIRASEGAPGLYALTVPTGGGKTVSSLAFALSHAVRYGMKRVIYVIPYTSIIEQNAREFKRVLGDGNVLEHHSGVDWDSDVDMEDPGMTWQALAAENWDAPVIVTTAVQFFESLFSNRPSRCRKLHNIADSIVIFDEAQMLPLPYLKPCVAAIAELTRHYHVTAVLCTATQPSLGRLFAQRPGTPAIREITPDIPALQAFFRRVRFERVGVMEDAALTEALSAQSQVLCIVNTRQRAQSIFSGLPEDGSYHLSTRMTADHRMRVLNEIRQRLAAGQPCRVVSTSLIEAGVDVDFPEVWREIAGLDSILQAAGRCNREGRRPPEESRVVIFESPDGIPKGMQPNAEAARQVITDDASMDTDDTIRRYFDCLYWLRGEQKLDEHDIMKLCAEIRMKSVAEAFHLIESDTRVIYIPTDANAADLDALRYGPPSRSLMRRLGRSAVSVYPWDWQKLYDGGLLEALNNGASILADPSAYDPQCGLKIDVDPGRGLWV